ncbi:acylphosphatase [Candidatus Sumerlaeota bacterium]|nr:acylphosphatase [Candidatus Sumerlaeota bacterium]
MTREPETQHNCFHATIKGRVQKVGYRVFTREAAMRFSITGWVKNLNDGSVEVFAEGEEVNLTEFLTELYRGPVLSHVQDIDLDWKSSEKQHEEFAILR